MSWAPGGGIVNPFGRREAPGGEEAGIQVK